MADLLTPELRELKDRMKGFINDVVIPTEPILMQDDEESESVWVRLVSVPLGWAHCNKHRRKGLGQLMFNVGKD